MNLTRTVNGSRHIEQIESRELRYRDVLYGALTRYTGGPDSGRAAEPHVWKPAGSDVDDNLAEMLLAGLVRKRIGQFIQRKVIADNGFYAICLNGRYHVFLRLA